ncbi:MAG: hypothetical protein GY811_15065 [Myxococcales bacterium]|nr:hypothetical protein [Myxococcales bacterium]
MSDLHIGRGKNRETGRYYRLEAFFYDADFLHFCEYLIEDARLRECRFKLVLNGDTFDLLRVDHDTLSDQSLREKRYGPALTPSVAASIMRQIIDGHPVFMQALAQVLAAGHDVIFLPGNHDIEMQWAHVQAVIQGALIDEVRRQGDEEQERSAAERLQFREWYYYEEGRIWIEHGCQYDAENAFQFYLRGTLADREEAIHKAEVDMPLGTFFQRYLYNQFGNITFLVPNSRSQFRYFRWLAINRPRLLAHVATVHLPFFWQIIRRIAKTGSKAVQLRECHEKRLNEMVETSPLGEKLREVESYKRIELDAAILAKQAISRAAKIAAYVLLAAVLATGLWTLGAQSIGTATFGVGFKALLFVGLNFGFLVLTLVTMMYFLLRPSGPGPDPWLAPTAKKISKILDVPIVTFGHTHDEDLRPLSLEQGAWYFNTGTWIAVFTPDSLMPRERVQYTFLRVQGSNGKLEHWSPGRSKSVPVILIDGDSDPKERVVAS